MNDPEQILNAYFRLKHSDLITKVYLAVGAGKLPTPDQVVELGHFTGNVNWWPSHQGDFIPVGYRREGNGFVPLDAPIPPGPTPDPSDPLAAFKQRQRDVSENCAWYLNDEKENGALLAAMGNVYHVYRNFYTELYAIRELPAAAVGVTSATGWAFANDALTPPWQADEGRAADALIAKHAADAGTTPPQPVQLP